MNKRTVEYKKMSRELRLLVKDIQDIMGYSKDQAIDWLNTSNIVFKGKKPVTLFMIGRGKIVIDYLIKVKRSKK